MKHKKITFWRCVQEAFLYKVKLPLIGHVPLNLLGFITLSGVSCMVDPIYLIPTIGLEGVYLTLMSGSKPVINSINKKWAQEDKELWEKKKEEMFASLTTPLKQRYKQFENIGKNIEAASKNYGIDNKDPRITVSNELMWMALKMLWTRNSIATNIKNFSLESLQLKIKSLKNSLAGETNEKIRKSLESTIEMMTKRLESMSGIEDKIKELDIELLSIEEQLALIHSSISLDVKNMDTVSTEVEKTMDSIKQADEWMQLNKELFTSLEGMEEKPPEEAFISITTD